MKLCLACNSPFDQSSWQCPKCGFTPLEKNGHLTFAPEIAEANDGFDPELFRKYAEIEPNHFWFRVRNRIICDTIRAEFPGIENMLEIGCGTGFVLSGIRRDFPQLSLYGSEIYLEGLSHAAKRLPGVELFQMDARRIPYFGEFDLIGAFDVLEHIDEDQAVLGQIHSALKPGGGAIVTVPQHAWLWSNADEYAHHKRRYTRGELVEKAERAGFSVERATSFVSLLLPAMLASRLAQKSPNKNDDRIDQGFKISRPMNRLLETVLELERKLIKAGVSFPAGGSLLVVLKKR